MNRTGFLTATATLVAASSGAAGAANVPGGSNLVERAADFDAQAFASAVGKPADVRQVWETVAFHASLLNNIKNSINGLQFGYGYPADRIAMALAPHGPSAALGFSDYLWQKYQIGKFENITDASGQTVTSNVYLSAHAQYVPSASPDEDKSMYQDTSVEMLQRRGLVMLACHTAIEEQARNIVKKGFAPAGMTASQVADDILSHLVPGVIVVPSMVATIAVLQAKYQYTYITLAL